MDGGVWVRNRGDVVPRLGVWPGAHVRRESAARAHRYDALDRQYVQRLYNFGCTRVFKSVWGIL